MDCRPVALPRRFKAMFITVSQPALRQLNGTALLLSTKKVALLRTQQAAVLSTASSSTAHTASSSAEHTASSGTAHKESSSTEHTATGSTGHTTAAAQVLKVVVVSHLVLLVVVGRQRDKGPVAQWKCEKPHHRTTLPTHADKCA